MKNKLENIKNQNSKFLRVRKSQNFNRLEPNKIISTVLNNEYFFIDFGDEKNVKILEKADPNDSDQEVHFIANNYIGGLNNLSPTSYKMFNYLHEKRALDQHRKNIDQVVRERIRHLHNYRKKKGINKTGQSISIKFNNMKGQSNENKEKSIFPENPNELEDYLQNAHNQMIFDKVRQGEQQLHKSISSAGQYKKMVRHGSLNIGKIKQQAQFKLPQINASKGKNKSIII